MYKTIEIRIFIELCEDEDEDKGENQSKIISIG